MAFEPVTDLEELQSCLAAWASAEALGLAMGGQGGPAPWGQGRWLAIACPGEATTLIDLAALAPPGPTQAEALGPLAMLLEAPRPIKAWTMGLAPLSWLQAGWGLSAQGLFEAQLARQLLGLGPAEPHPSALCQAQLGQGLPPSPAGPGAGHLRGEGPPWPLLGPPSGEVGAWGPALCAEAEAALRLRAQLRPRLLEAGLQRVASLEFALLPLLAKVACRGVALDAQAWRRRTREEAEARAEVAAEARRLLGLGTGPLAQSALFAAEQLPGLDEGEDRVLASTPTVKAALARLGLELPDTADSTLAPHAGHPAVAALRRWRQLHHAALNHGEAFLRHLHPLSQRLHPDWHQLASASGRMSTSHPNLQAMPRGAAYRQAVVAGPGQALVVADYSQIELRILADRAQERSMIAAFEQGEDLHRSAASELFWCPLEAVTSEQRRKAKGILFGLVYGQGPRGMAEALGVPLEEAQALVHRTHERYPRLKAYLEAAGRAAIQGEPFRSALGRRALGKAPEGPAATAAAERFGRNFPIQATCSDLLKGAMLAGEAALAPLGGRLVLSVHDELIAELPEAQAEAGAQALREAMLDAAPGLMPHAPAEVEVQVGRSWGKA